MYGDRADPARALGRLGEGLRDGARPDLNSVVAAVAESLHSPYVVVVDADRRPLASAGQPQPHVAHEVSLDDGVGRIGALRVIWRTPSDPPSRADRTLIEALAVPVAVAVHATRLARDVEESRARVIEVRAAERHRLRSDLHDGVGPALSGAALGIEAALRSGQPERTREILGVVHGEIKHLVEEIRHLIDDLGPAGLEHRWPAVCRARARPRDRHTRSPGSRRDGPGGARRRPPDVSVWRRGGARRRAAGGAGG